PRVHPVRIVLAVVVAEVALVMFGGADPTPAVEGLALDPAGRVVVAVGALATLVVLSALADHAATADRVATRLVGLAGLALVVTTSASLVTAAIAATATAIALFWGLIRAPG